MTLEHKSPTLAGKMGKEEKDFVTHLKALVGDSGAQKEIRKVQDGHDREVDKRIKRQAARAAEFLQEKVTPLFEQINNHFLSDNGKINIQIEDGGYNYGYAILNLIWNQTNVLWASNSPSDDVSKISIGAGSEVVRHHSKDFFLSDKKWQKNAQDYLLELLSNPLSTNTALSGCMDHDGPN